MALSTFDSVRTALKDLWLDQVRWLIPTDPRAIVLCCFFTVIGGMGAALLSEGEPIGWGYLAMGAAGWLFAQTRLMPIFIWLVVTGIGLWAISSGASSAWVEVAYALVLVGVSLFPVADPDVYPPLGSPTVNPQPSLSRISAAAEVSPPTPLVIRTLGRLQVLAGNQDLAPALLDKRVLGYLWCWLLAAAIRTKDGAVSRVDLASELAPGPNRRAQLEKLRRTLWDLQHNLPQPLAALVCADRNFVRIDLAATSCDLVQLRDLIAVLSKSVDTEVSESDLTARLESISSERFLPEFDDLARSAHHSRGAGMQAVTDVRNWALQTRIEAARLLARRSRPRASSGE